METTILPSGAVLGLQHAPFALACSLRRAVAAELARAQIDLRLDATNLTDLKKFMAQEVDFNAIKNILCQLLSSESLERSLMDCAKSCTLNEVKITPALFEDPTLRGDYFPVLWEVAKLNLQPFFENLASQLPALSQNVAGSPKSP